MIFHIFFNYFFVNYFQVLLVLEVDGAYKPFSALTLILSLKREREFFRYHPHPAPPPSRRREFLINPE